MSKTGNFGNEHLSNCNPWKKGEQWANLEKGHECPALAISMHLAYLLVEHLLRGTGESWLNSTLETCESLPAGWAPSPRYRRVVTCQYLGNVRVITCWWSTFSEVPASHDSTVPWKRASRYLLVEHLLREVSLPYCVRTGIPLGALAPVQRMPRFHDSFWLNTDKSSLYAWDRVILSVLFLIDP